ncbi:MAG: hypothetical protein AB7U83_02285 [Vicinamibacterales bacterium]
MTRCLTPDELLDAAEARLTAERAAHVERCGRCRRAVAELTATLDELTGAAVPEPPPLTWAAMQRAIRLAVAAGPAPRPWWSRRGWPALVPLAGLGLVLVALAGALERTPAPATPVAAVAAAGDVGEAGTARPGEVLAEDALSLVLALAETLPEGDADLLGTTRLPDLGEVAAATLTGEELQALEVLLREAVDRPES